MARSHSKENNGGTDSKSINKTTMGSFTGLLIGTLLGAGVFALAATGFMGQGGEDVAGSVIAELKKADRNRR